MPNFNSDSIQVTLNSRFGKQSRYSTSKVVFDFNNLYVPKKHHLHISLVSATIPYSFYTINNSNNKLMYTINAETYTLYIDPGNYSISQLTTYLNANLITGLTCTYDSIRNKMTFSASTGFTFDISSTALRMMGITTYVSVSNKITSTNCVNLQTIQYINVRTNFKTGNFTCDQLYLQTLLCSIPVSNHIPNSNIIYQHQGNVFTIDLYTNTLDNFTIALFDQDDNYIDLNGCDWSMVIQIDIVDFTK
jgi:hypothetical protein